MTERCVRKKLSTKLKSKKGDAIGAVIFFVFLLIYVLIPIMAAVLEQQLFYLRATEIREGMEMASLATYSSMNAGGTSIVVIGYDTEKLDSTFKYYLTKNLHINPDMTPKPTGCIPQGTVTVDQINLYLSGFPVTCPDGKVLTRPTIHAVITVPIKPTLYSYTILSLLGVSTIDCRLHLDTEIPVNQ